MRLFVALPLPPEVRAHLLRTQQLLLPHLPHQTVRWTPEAQMHLTLRFLGEVRQDQLAPLKTALLPLSDRHAPFQLVLSDLGCFPNLRAPRVIWLGLGGDLGRLSSLQSDVQQACAGFGDAQDDRPFSPHLTIGRLRLPPRPPAQPWDKLFSRASIQTLPSWNSLRIELIQSHLDPAGAHHEILLEVPLSGCLKA
jgi:RNA 2',3'-cyclic 3'-phosphodiesterase